jgi:hypothetical protein
MAKWQVACVVVFVAVFALTALITGSLLFFIPALMLAALVVGYAGVNRFLTHRIAERHDSLEDAMSDEKEPLPSSHLIPDNDTAAGDTPEAHDEINPHDLPPDHPGRQAAEEQASGTEGTTRGDDDLADAAPERDEDLERPARDRRFDRERPPAERGG